MSTVKTSTGADVSAAEPFPRRWTREEYYRMGEMGLFEGQRVELIDGEILQVTPQKEKHFKAISLIGEALRQAFGTGYWVRVQGPLAIANDMEPEPNLAVIPGTPREYTDDDHPSTALLIVEVSNTTLAYDRGRKASLYALIGVEDYWIVNLIDRQLEVYRRPIRHEAQPFGFHYADAHLFQADDSVTPLSATEAVRVADLLP